MSLLQIKKPTFHIILTFLVIVLLSSNIHVQAEDIDRKDKADSLWKKGRDTFNSIKIVFSEKAYQPALETFQNSLALYKEIGDRQSEADVLTWIARVYLDTGDSSKLAYAKNCLEQAQYIYNELNSSPGKKASIKDIDACMEAMLLYIMGESCLDDGDKNSALEKFKAAVQILSKIGERFYEARILLKIGNVQDDLENYSEEERYYREALAIFRELGNKGFEGVALGSLGRIFYYRHEDVKFLININEALRIFEQLKDMREVAYCLTWKGTGCLSQRNYDGAQTFYKEALEIYKQMEDQKRIARLSLSVGESYKGMGYYNIPIKYYRQALDIVQEVGNDPREAEILKTVGKLYSKMGDYDEALKPLNKAMQIYKENGDRDNQGQVLIDIGNVNSKLGNYLEAIDNLQEALKSFEGIDDRVANSNKGLALTTLSGVYRLLGDEETAKEYDSKYKAKINVKYKAEEDVSKWDRLSFLSNQGFQLINENKNDKVVTVIYSLRVLSRNLGKETGDNIFERSCLDNIGFLYQCLKEYQDALNFYNQALEVSRTHTDKAGELIELLKIAGIYDYPWLSDYPNALDYYEQALVIAKEIGDRPSEEKCLTSIGQIYMDQEKDKESEEYFQIALLVSSEMGAQERIWKVQNKLGLLAYLSGDLQKAKSYYIESIKTIESIRSKISVEEYKTTFIEDKLSIYTDLIYLLLELKENEEAFNYVERAKSRSLLDLLGNKIKLKKGTDKELSQEEIRLQKEIKGILDKMRKGHSQPNEKQGRTLKGWDKELKKTRKQYEKHLLKIKEENAELYSMVNMNPLTLKEVQELIDPDTTLLEYYAIESVLEGSPILYVIIWVVDKTNCEVVIRTLTDPSSLSELTSWISGFREKITTLQSDYEIDAEELYDFFIGSAKPYIKTKRICIVPYSVLHYLPFHALVNVPEICGIGVFLNVDNEILTVGSTVEGTSAFEAGLKTGDKIIEIDGDLTTNMSLQEAVSRLRGKPSTTVLLAIEDVESKTRKKVALEREIIAKSNDYSKFIVSDTKGNELKSPRFLIEEYDIFYAPSASVLKFVTEKRKEVSGKVLAFGNPELGDKDLNLPYAEEEVRKIKESYPETSIYVKDKATEVKAKQLSGNYDIIHFASHGELNPQSPLFSCIKMAKEKDEDGRLEVHEIFNLDLENASLVTLSACETGLGKLSKGDELIGLTRGFVYAGTPSIVASLWEVNDKSTSDLMSLFYKNLKTHSKVEALRMAQLEMINGEAGRGIVRGVGGITTSNEGEDNPQTSRTVNGSHPYFWAPFILLGDWN